MTKLKIKHYLFDTVYCRIWWCFALIITFLSQAKISQSQTCTVNAGNDVHICPGDSTTLQASNVGLITSWKSNASLTDTTNLTPVVSPSTTTTYILHSEFPTSTNLITNSDFNSGNSGFTSGYTYQPPPNSSEGQYWVSTNAQVWNPGMATCGDHTTGSGDMMIVNGAITLNVFVWCQTIAVQPNTNYAFSCWLQSLSTPNPAQLQFSINGASIGAVFTASVSLCVWQQFYCIWNSGNNTTADICITNQNPVANKNDFALDDFEFSPLCSAYDSVTVYVETPIAEFTTNQSGNCDSATVSFTNTSVNANQFTWNFGDNTTDTSVNPTHSYYPGNYSVSLTATNSYGCNDTIISNNIVHVSPSPVASFTSFPSNSVNIPVQDSIQFIHSTPGASTFDWLINGLSFSNLPNPFYQFQDSGIATISLIATTANGCSDSTSLNYFIYTPVVPDAPERVFDLFIPKSFTPNGDNINDYFTAQGFGINTYHLRIFNRWGREIFNTTDITPGWNGIAEDGSCPSGSYAYLIEITDIENMEHEFGGLIYLIR